MDKRFSSINDTNNKHPEELMQERHSMHALQFHLVNKTVLGFGTSSEMSTFEAGKYDRTCQENSRVIAALLGEAVVILSTEVWRRCDFFFLMQPDQLHNSPEQPVLMPHLSTGPMQ